MIDPSFDTLTVPAPSYDDLQSSLERITQDRDFWQSKYHSLSDKVLELETYIKDNFSYIDEEVAQRLVEIFDLEITQEYDVQVTVTFTGTVNAPLNFDMDELEGELEANIQASIYSDIVNSDFMVDRMEIDWSEN
jgi:hypothetical protein